MTAGKLVALAAGSLLVLGSAVADDKADKHGFVDRTFKGNDGKEAKYVLFVPQSYKGDKDYPIILFLHGAGEREGGKKGPVEVGIGPAIKKYGEKDFPFFVVFPQCAAGKGHNWQADGEDAQRALAMLEDVMKTYKIDRKRVYLTGLSMGGMGTWSLAVKYPDRWAAIVPICGRADAKFGELSEQARTIKDLPCWCFHGDADTAVPVQGSRDMIKAIKDAGGKPEYTEYPKVGHNSWDEAYGTKKLYEWLLSHKLK
jgi:predicted peptidase